MLPYKTNSPSAERSTQW